VIVPARFTIPGEPQGKARARTVRNGAFTRTYTPEKTAAYENLVRIEYERQCEGANFADNSLRVSIRASYGVPKSTGKGKRGLMLTGFLYPSRKPDCDNIAKVVCDALNGLAYRDDAQIAKLDVLKQYAEIPGVTVEIWPLGSKED